jgi:uncharacterized coiled-coil protein SlyX
MTRLEDLMHSLGSVLLRYHDSQKVNILVKDKDPVKQLKKTRALASQILEDKDVSFEKRFEEINTESLKTYTDRKFFLPYILNEISYIKSMLDRKKSFSPKEFEEFKKQMTQMLINFRHLLITDKDKTHDVTYSGSKVSVTLIGLINNGYVGSHWCNSGNLLSEEVFQRFNITDSSNDDTLAALAHTICNEHQNNLLLPELLAEKSKLEELTKSQKASIDSLTPKLADAEKRISEQTTIIESHAPKLADAEKRVSEQAATIQSLTPKLADAEKSISEHAATTLSLTSRLSISEKRASDLAASAESARAEFTRLDTRYKELEATHNGLKQKLPLGLAYGSLFAHSAFGPAKIKPINSSAGAAVTPQFSPLGSGDA